jgi:hypothetical protein
VPSTGVPTPSALCPYRPSIEPAHPQIDQEDDQSRTSHGRLEELRRGSPLRSQDQDEPQQQRLAVELMREEGDYNNKKRELQGEKQQY